MQAFLLSTGLVALAEVGDKTQLLAFMLAARYRRPLPIVAGILLATVLNHALAAALGSWLQSWIGPTPLRWALGVSFIVMALWTLVPDELDPQAQPAAAFSIFGTTLLAFFAAEMGDKTQIATVALAAQYGAMLPVLAGTTLGMMIANTPAVLFGERIAKHIPIVWVHRAAALLFALMGAAALLDAGRWLGY